jgi:membrane-associated phospholipid phosphatase
MVASCCRCAIACSVIASLAAVPARAQSLSASDQIPDAAPSQSGLLAPPAARPSPFFSRLFKATLNDFQQVPTRDNVLVAAIGSVAATSVRPLDPKVTTTMSGSQGMGQVFSSGEFLGSAAVQMAAAVATGVVGKISGNRRVGAIGADLVRAQIVTQTLTAGIKLSVRRGRPDGTQFSFPSGHASTTFATATVLQRHLGWKGGVPAYALAGYVAASRVQVQRHYLSDVVLGATLGVVAGRSVTIGRGDARFALGPSVVPGGAGVNFTLLHRH